MFHVEQPGGILLSGSEPLLRRPLIADSGSYYLHPRAPASFTQVSPSPESLAYGCRGHGHRLLISGGMPGTPQGVQLGEQWRSPRARGVLCRPLVGSSVTPLRRGESDPLQRSGPEHRRPESGCRQRTTIEARPWSFLSHGGGAVRCGSLDWARSSGSVRVPKFPKRTPNADVPRGTSEANSL
jgi:hypothetical protein